jgi:uncharacterized membrane protein YhhN
MELLKRIYNRLDIFSQGALLTAIVSAAVFILFHGLYHDFFLSVVLKVIPALTLSYLSFRYITGVTGKLLAIGLLFSAGGDAVLDIDRTHLFLIGLVLFLTAHIFYIITFFRLSHFSRKRIIPKVLVLTAAIILAFLLQDINHRMFLPVMIYLVIITVMTFLSLSLEPFNRVVAIGAVLFMVSDTVIAVNKFLHPIPSSTVFNISLYYIAQFHIILGFIAFHKD